MRLLGVDTGGTFTDFVYVDAGVLRSHKVLSTPRAPEEAILQGLRELAVETDDLLLVHGSTVATNAVLEGRGARTVYITNRGFADVLSIGRQARRDLYDLQPPRPAPPVPRALCLETGGRIGADGAVLEPLGEAALAALRERIEALAPEAVAINLLFSFLDERFERAIEAIVPEGIFVSRSSRVLPEYREYERGMATWLNAYVGPLMARYLGRLREALGEGARLTVMQSHGGTIDAGQAAAHAVELLLSGPAGGLRGARHVASASGRERLLSFDMGGTSTDVALIDGEPALTREGEIAGYPVAVAMVDMHTIGAGGGSVAWIDEGGLLQVGPRSAGADPGPACYGRGGVEPTVTDANLLLGRLPLDGALAGSLRLDREAARAALERLAEGLRLGVEAAALGVLRLADAHMAEALRVISVRRGLDPADYTLLPFGGAGGLHVCALAEAIGAREALVPVHGGVLSALGMLAAPPARQRAQTLIGPLAERRPEEIEAGFAALAAAARAELAAEGVTQPREQRTLELRYVGQSSTLTLPWRGVAQDIAQGIAQGVEDFHAAHEAAFGHRLDMPVELVNLGIGLTGEAPALALPGPAPGPAARARSRQAVFGCARPAEVYTRAELACDQRIAGPALIAEPLATTYIAPGWGAQVDAVGNLVLHPA